MYPFSFFFIGIFFFILLKNIYQIYDFYDVKIE